MHQEYENGPAREAFSGLQKADSRALLDPSLKQVKNFTSSQRTPGFIMFIQGLLHVVHQLEPRQPMSLEPMR